MTPNLIQQLATAIRTEAARHECPDCATEDLFTNAIAALAEALGMEPVMLDEDGEEVEVVSDHRRMN